MYWSKPERRSVSEIMTNIVLVHEIMVNIASVREIFKT